MSFIVNDLLRLSHALTTQGEPVGHFRHLQQLFHDPQLFQSSTPTSPPPPSHSLSHTALNVLFVTGILVFCGYFAPSWILRLWPQLNPTWVKAETTVADTLLDFSDLNSHSQPLRHVNPLYDLSLPDGKWLIADRIGIKAEILTNASINDHKTVDRLLQRGLYLYPDHQNFGWQGETVIIAGHHYNTWLSPQSSAQNFQHLSQFIIGDRLEIISDHKKWTYEIFMMEQSAQISSVKSDLILYTCVWWWDSDLRLFVYARLLDGPSSSDVNSETTSS
jgi:hypothetical protein